jgi:protein ImuB
MLWIALELPSLPLQLAERGGTSPSPLVVADGPAQRPLVACANALATAEGVREGQPIAAAKVLCGTLKVLARDATAEHVALEQLAAWACQFTPGVCIDGQGLLLEVEGSLRLFGGHGKIAGALRQGLRDLGYRATFGIAPTALAARLFARAEAQGSSIRSCVAIGELGGRIADLPLFLLDWPERTLALLADLGILRIRDILALPREGLSRRFGPETLADLDKLTGRAPDPRSSYQPPATFHARLELPAEAKSTEALLFPLRRLLVQMEGFLRARGAGVQRIELRLEPVRAKSTAVSLEFASPECEAEFILALAREKLGRTQLAAPTLTIELSAVSLLPFAPRASTWLPGREELALDRGRFLERLSARIGSDRVFGLAIADDHRPEKISKKGTAELGSDHHFRSAKQKWWSDPNSVQPFFVGPRPLWLLHRPLKLVTKEGMPTHFGPLELTAGPERIEAGWWDGEPVSRDYFVAVDPAGEKLWVYREHLDPTRWFLHGLFA